MLYISYLISICEVLLVIIPVLLTVAFITIAERKTMASMQRRLGPNVVGYYGLLQAFADALKLIIKEYISPTQANIALFFLGPLITLIFALLGYLVIPFGPSLSLSDFNLDILYLLAMSSLSTYGILLAGWSANSKYAFLGSLRSTAQLISYELILSSIILLIVLLSGSLNLTINIELQRATWFVLPLFPMFIAFFIGIIAETNRAPFDLAEAESELVSGFMTEHAAVIFVFFFLAEYASIVLICIFASILFLGGYLLNYNIIIYKINEIFVFFYYYYDTFLNLYYVLYNYYDNFSFENIRIFSYNIYSEIKNLFKYNVNTFKKEELYLEEKYINNTIIEGILSGIILNLKTSFLIFVFIWVRASFPRIRFDQLMSFCWTTLLPIVVSFIFLIPCVLYSFSIFSNNINYLLF